MAASIELAPDPTISLRYCLKAVAERKPGLLFAYSFFSLLRDILGFERGMLLLARGEDHRLVPACSTGFSNASTYRMRIHTEELDLLIPDRENVHIILSLAHPFVRERLVTEDITNSDKVLLIRFSGATEISGALLCTNSPYSDLPVETLSTLLSGIAVSFSSALDSDRGAVLSQTRGILHQSTKKDDFSCFKTGDLSHSIAASFVHALPGSLELDLLSVLWTAFSAFHSWYDPERHWFCVDRTTVGSDDMDFLMEQAARQLEQALGCSGEDLSVISFMENAPALDA